MANQDLNFPSMALAEALSNIDDILLNSESDEALMLDMLNSIIESAEAGKNEYLARRMAAQKVELDELRAKFGGAS
jgi:hypothetical protein